VSSSGGDVDAGLAPDSGVPDAGTVDSGVRDGGAVDAGAQDAGVPDAGPVDAGPVDAGAVDPFSTDRNLFFGASRCADAGFQLCEDFESGQIDNATWSQASSGNLAVETTDHARGTHALHITQAGNGSSYIRETKTFPATNNTYFGRAFFKFIRLPMNADMSYAHWTILAGSGTVVDGEIRVSGQLSNSTNLFGVGTDNRTMATGTGDWTTSDNDPNGMPGAVPTNTWICIEWMHDGQHNETRFYWDDVEHPSLHTTSTMNGGNGMPYLMPQFTNVWVGWAEYQTSSVPFELWVDEIAIDSARIGCVR
jgi:hypothetical protein